MVPLTLDGLSMSLCPRLVSGLRPPRDTRPRSASETKACRAEWSSPWLLRQCQAVCICMGLPSGVHTGSQGDRDQVGVGEPGHLESCSVPFQNQLLFPC